MPRSVNLIATFLFALMFPAVTSAQSAQEWTHMHSIDDFTDESIHVASISQTVNGHRFSLFVNCRDNTNLTIGIAGSYINPVGSVANAPYKTIKAPVRFDSHPPEDAYFHYDPETGSLLRAYNPESLDLLSSLGHQSVLQVIRRSDQIFAKRLTINSKIRVRLPQYLTPTTLRFPLAGAKDAILAVANGCGTKVEGGTHAFIDERGIPYNMFSEMLLDQGWGSRYSLEKE